MEADTLAWVNWEEYATWNSTQVDWDFPAEFTIPENEGFSTAFQLGVPYDVYLNCILERKMDQTIFASDGIQNASFTVRFTDTDFLGYWGHIGANEHYGLGLPRNGMRRE